MSTPTQQFIKGLGTRKFIAFAIACIITLTVWNLPLDAFGIDGLTIVHRRIIAVFAFAILCWITECIPAWATSVAVIGILLFTSSDSSLSLFSANLPEDVKLLSYKALLATFADPIVILFLGGFILAEAASKTGLDVVFARSLLKPFGKKSEIVLLGFLLVTGVFSMFVSNTATAAMMLTFLAPVFKALPADGKGRIALTLAIPVAANIGGMGSPIGTPPNMIALKYLNDPEGLNMNIGFGQWMIVMMPYAILLLIIGWFFLKKMFPFKAKTIDLKIEGEVKKDWRTVVVAVTFIVTVLLWLLDRVTGINANAVAMLPIAVFAVTGVIKAKDLQGLSWDVLWMVAGGFALGLALNSSGLAEAAIDSIPFGSFSPLVILVVSGLICYLLSNFISNTATSALLVPILAMVSKGMGDSLGAIGGVATILIGIAISASCAMCLPISTPPNAIAYSTGLVEQKQMLRIGLLMGIIGMVLGYVILFVLGQVGYFG
ncbi:MAG: SLC13/DASS family transporter [Bacteroidales bacterium]|nr:SLC13/DASS family transporter [Bacteroidales bacterium]